MKSFALLVTSALTLAVAAPAAAQIAYSGGSATYTGVGLQPGFPAQPGGPFDIVDFTPVSGNFTGNGSYTVNDVAFTVGFNRFTAAPFGGTFTLTGTLFGSVPFTYNVDYSGTIASTDTIRIGGNTINIFGQAVYFQPLVLTAGVDQTVRGQLIAQVNPVPEPATWAMMIVGFGAAGAAMRRRRTTTTVRYA